MQKYQLQYWVFDEKAEEYYLGDVEAEAPTLDHCIALVKSQNDEYRKELYNWNVSLSEYDEKLKIWETVDSCNLDTAKEYFANLI